MSDGDEVTIQVTEGEIKAHCLLLTNMLPVSILPYLLEQIADVMGPELLDWIKDNVRFGTIEITDGKVGEVTFDWK